MVKYVRVDATRPLHNLHVDYYSRLCMDVHFPPAVAGTRLESLLVYKNRFVPLIRYSKINLRGIRLSKQNVILVRSV